MKNSWLSYLVILLAPVFLFSCNKKNNQNKNAESDSLTLHLKDNLYNNPDSIIGIAEQLLKKDDIDKGSKANIYLLLANGYELIGKYDSAIEHANKGLKLSNNKKLDAALYNEIGVCYDYKSDYKNAIANYEEAQKNFEDANDTIGYIKVKNNIGLIYQNTGELARAKEIFSECLQLSKKNHYPDEEIMALSNLGAVENELHHSDTALYYFKQVLASDQKSGNEAYISYSFHNVGETYKNLKRFDSAVFYYEKAIELKEKLNLAAALVNSYKGYADLLIETNKLTRAELYLNKAFQMARNAGTQDYLQDCYYLQSRLSEKKGDYKTAYAALDSFHAIKDSISNAKFKSELIIKEKDHELAANEKLRQQQAMEFENEKITFILFIVFLLAVTGTLLYLFNKQKRLNKQLAQQKQQIEEGFAQRNQLLSFIAHEIRNPLGGILGLTDLLLHDSPSESQKELLAYQKQASQHLLSLMNDVLDYQKLGSGKVALNNVRFSLRDVLYQAYALYQSEIRQKKLSYDLDYDENIPAALLGDPIRLTQIFTNLLNNAIKFTERGTIVISAKQLNLTSMESTIVFKVSDSGVGIPKEDHEKIFELYVQSSTNKSAQLGTGLGLSIVRNLLSLMNSNIQLESDKDTGTTFSFLIKFRLPQ